MQPEFCSREKLLHYFKIFSAFNWVFLDSRFAMVSSNLSTLAGNPIRLDRLEWTDFNLVMLESTFTLCSEWFLFMSFQSSCHLCSRLTPQSSLFNFYCGVLGGVALVFDFLDTFPLTRLCSSFYLLEVKHLSFSGVHSLLMETRELWVGLFWPTKLDIAGWLDLKLILLQ